MAARAPNKQQLQQSVEKPFAEIAYSSIDQYPKTSASPNRDINQNYQGNLKRSLNKRAVNIHTRDLNSYPFFNYGELANENKRLQSQGAAHKARDTATAETYVTLPGSSVSPNGEPKMIKSQPKLQITQGLKQSTKLSIRNAKIAQSNDSRRF